MCVIAYLAALEAQDTLLKVYGFSTCQQFTASHRSFPIVFSGTIHTMP